ncbi:MAG: biotin--[acetyl-CoA-carboxylase] ligase [Paludibacter sp.]|nr:biotin--[acetyl-CoA-carboxylase] ligase [Paludibacter sp.]
MYVKETDSTNHFLKGLLHQQQLPEFYFVRAGFQNAGKGQTGNSWESETGKNMLMSLVFYPKGIAIEEQFMMSMLVSVAIHNVLSSYCNDISIKWPNDIYYQQKKICGILIEASLQGADIKHMIVGIGLNVNQIHFTSNAPNPVSLLQITERKHSPGRIAEKIVTEITKLYHSNDLDSIVNTYKNLLYRKNGFYSYKDSYEIFQAKIIDVEKSGKLILETPFGEKKEYYFKEVEYL